MTPDATVNVSLGPGVVVHGAADLALARESWRALGPAAGGLTLGLFSARAAGCFMGPLWWAALVAQPPARPDPHGGGATEDWLDCGAAPGRAMQALRLGLPRLILAGCGAQRAAVLDRAAPLGARIVQQRPACLDLAAPGAPRALAAWLAGGWRRACDDIGSGLG